MRLDLLRVDLGLLLATQMSAFSRLKRAHLALKFSLLDDQGIAGRRSLEFGGFGQRRVDVFRVAYAERARKHLPDEFRLAVQKLPPVRVERPLGDVAIDLDFRVLIALPHDATVALLHVRRLPRRIEVVHRNELALHVRANAHLAGRPDQHAHVAVTNLLEQLRLLVVVLGVVDEGNLVRWDAALDQTVLHILVEVELALKEDRRLNRIVVNAGLASIFCWLRSARLIKQILANALGCIGLCFHALDGARRCGPLCL